MTDHSNRSTSSHMTDDIQICKFLICLQVIGRRRALCIPTLVTGLICIASIPTILFGQSLIGFCFLLYVHFFVILCDSLVLKYTV